MTNENIKHIEGDKKCKCMGCVEDRKNAKEVKVTGSVRNSNGTTTTKFNDGTTHTTRKSFTWDD